MQPVEQPMSVRSRSIEPVLRPGVCCGDDSDDEDRTPISSSTNEMISYGFNLCLSPSISVMYTTMELKTLAECLRNICLTFRAGWAQPRRNLLLQVSVESSIE